VFLEFEAEIQIR